MVRPLVMTQVLLILSLTPAPSPAQAPADTAAPAPPGQLVDVGGYRLHIYCRGQGSPTVVLIHGFGDHSFDWELVVEAVAPTTRVCAYDRAGQAWSDPGPRPRSIERLAEELHALLQNTRIAGPYVVVGHSWGGLVARVFQARNASLVTGMVLVDASHEDQWLGIGRTLVRPRFTTIDEWNRLAPRQPDSLDARRDLVFPRPPGAARIEPPFDRLPPDVQRWRVWARRKPVFILGGDWDGLWSIRSDLITVHATRAGRSHPLKSLPLVVITAGKPGFEPDSAVSVEERRRQRTVNQKDLVGLSSNARQIIATYSEHHVQLDQPDLVAESIRQVVDASRRRAALCCRDAPRDP